MVLMIHASRKFAQAGYQERALKLQKQSNAKTTYDLILTPLLSSLPRAQIFIQCGEQHELLAHDMPGQTPSQLVLEAGLLVGVIAIYKAIIVCL
jgi:hypothetical protein